MADLLTANYNPQTSFRYNNPVSTSSRTNSTANIEPKNKICEKIIGN